MKKLISILLVVMAVPAFAAPTLELVDQGSGVVALNYVTDGNLVSGFGITVTVDSGATITAVDDLADVDGYWVHPSNIVIDDVNGIVDSNGSPVVGTLPAASIVLEFGALYEKGVELPPAVSGTLCTLTVDASCTMTVTTDNAQGGIVTEELVSYTDVTDSLAVSLSVVCPGDADGDGDVDFNDFLILKGAYGSTTGDGNYAAGADYDDDGDVDFSDFLELKANYGNSCN